jgi:hypothetical protein
MLDTTVRKKRQRKKIGFGPEEKKAEVMDDIVEWIETSDKLRLQ